MRMSAVQADKWLSVQVENRMIDAIHIVQNEKTLRPIRARPAFASEREHLA